MIERAVHHKYRCSDKKYGTSILNALTNFLFTNKNISKIVLEIKIHNLPSIISAIKNGFTIDNDLFELFCHEDYQYIPYTRVNPHYQHLKVTDPVKTKGR